MKSIRRTALVALAAALAAPGTAGAGMMGPGGPPMRRPAFLDHLFLPQTVMSHQQAIGLTEVQRKAITAAITETQQHMVELQWALEAESETMGKLLDQDPVDEKAAMAQAEKLMTVEQKIKSDHLRLLIRVKNELKPEQEQKLRELQPRRRRGRQMDEPPPGAP